MYWVCVIVVEVFAGGFIGRLLRRLQRIAMEQRPEPTWSQAGSLLAGSLGVVWSAGLLHALWAGRQPGFVPPQFVGPYPLQGVVETCGMITFESALLCAILRPSSFGGHPRRVLAALAVFVPLWIVELALVSGWTDQAGYRYSNGLFLFAVVIWLIVVAALSLRGARLTYFILGLAGCRVSRSGNVVPRSYAWLFVAALTTGIIGAVLWFDVWSRL